MLGDTFSEVILKLGEVIFAQNKYIRRKQSYLCGLIFFLLFQSFNLITSKISVWHILLYFLEVFAGIVHFIIVNSPPKNKDEWPLRFCSLAVNF